MWPTPNVPNGGRTIDPAKITGRTSYNAAGKKIQIDLNAAVKKWPTPRSGTDTMCGGQGHYEMLKGTEIERPS